MEPKETKFKIVIDNKTYGKIESEEYDGDENTYLKVLNEFTGSNKPLGKLDFYDKKGNYTVIPEKIVNESIVYIIRV